MEIQENVILGGHTTLHVGGPARYFIECGTPEEVLRALAFAKEKNLPLFVLGGGSNVLISDTGFQGVVIHLQLMGKKIVEDTSENVLVEIGVGEVLDDVISWTVESGWWGIENLSFVPGLFGGALYINAGCYGQEIASTIESVSVLDRNTNEMVELGVDECGYAYRKSRFNTSDRNRFVLLGAKLRLQKKGTPLLTYVDLDRWFRENRTPAQREVRDALITIRTNKGQNPKEVWSAGSFFSNFRLTKEEFKALLMHIQKEYGMKRVEELVRLVQKVRAPSDADKIKVPAAWILDQLLGLKGYTIGGAKHSDKQVLNLVNAGTAKADDFVKLYHHARDLVKQKTGLELVPEPEFVGF